jgi:RimJ/RimL family protein N-acetyltransferase
MNLQSERIRLIAVTPELCTAVCRGAWPPEGPGCGRLSRPPSALMRELAAALLRHNGRDGSAEWTAWLIFDREWPEPHGCLVLQDEIRRGGTAEVGWELELSAEGHGYATEAVRTLGTWACRDMGLSMITAHISIENLGSKAVAHGAGFVCTSQVRGDGRERWQMTTMK